MRRIYFKESIRLLKENNILIIYDDSNGCIIDSDGDEIGIITKKIANKLLSEVKLIGNGKELTSGNKYYKYYKLCQE